MHKYIRQGHFDLSFIIIIILIHLEEMCIKRL